MAKANPKGKKSKYTKTRNNRGKTSRPHKVAHKQGPPATRLTSAVLGRCGGLIFLVLAKIHLTMTIGGLQIAVDLVSRNR